MPETLSRRIASSVLSFASACLVPPINGLVLLRSIADYAKLCMVDFKPRSDDIFIASYPRSGTTWMQMLLYQMTSDGEMNFKHIAEVCPWFERTIVNGRDLEALSSPRVFKTHLRYWLLPGKRRCRFIYVVRDGKDVAVSFYHFYSSHLGFKGDFAKFFPMFLKGGVQGGQWFTHVTGWLAHSNADNVLVIRYEELSADLESCVKKIAQFCGIEIAADRMQQILERSSYAFMKQFEKLFDHKEEVIWEQGVKDGSFLRKGKTGEGGIELSEEQQKEFDALYRKKLGAINLDRPATPQENRATA